MAKNVLGNKWGPENEKWAQDRNKVPVVVVLLGSCGIPGEESYLAQSLIDIGIDYIAAQSIQGKLRDPERVQCRRCRS